MEELRGISLDGIPVSLVTAPARTSYVTEQEAQAYLAASLHDARRWDYTWSSELAVHDTRKIVAILTTQDGAERSLVLPWPPQREVRVPLYTWRSLGAHPNAQAVSTTSLRIYVFKHVEQDGVRHLMRARYEEQL